MIHFKKFTWNWLSIMIGFHYGRNPVSGQRFLHVAPMPFFGMDFGFKDDFLPFEDVRLFQEDDLARVRVGLPPDGSAVDPLE